jgi:hypothetical protein
MHSRHTLARAVLALALVAPPVAAQECVDDYIASETLYGQSIEDVVASCSLASSPCDFGSYVVYRVAGGGSVLQDTIDQAAALGGTEPVVIVAGPEDPYAPQEVYDILRIQAGDFPQGLSILSRWGPRTCAIDSMWAGKCVSIIGGSPTDGPVRIGAALNRLVLDDLLRQDYDGWYGFELRNGAPTTGEQYDGAGGLVQDVMAPVHLAGNEIHDNVGFNQGAGIRLDGAEEVDVALNHIHDNQLGVGGNYDYPTPLRGAGVYQHGGLARFIGNRIEGNGFGSELFADSVSLPEPPRQGGGVAVDLVTTGAPTASHYACSNKVLDNDASEGGGYWVSVFAAGSSRPARLELNEIAGNTTWTPEEPTILDGAFRGGGVALIGDSVSLPKPPSMPTMRIELVANRIHDNAIGNPGFELVDPLEPDGVGGGVWSSVVRNDTSDRVAIVGNAIWANKATGAGGGAWLRHPSTLQTPVSGELHHNTFAWNYLSDTSGVGAGIFLDASTRFDGSSAVLYDNTVEGVVGTTADVDWFAETGVVDKFRYSEMTSAFAASKDLFGTASSDADPLLVPGDWHLDDDVSPCVDTAEPGAAISTALAALGLTVDPDGGPRSIDRVPGIGVGANQRDRGADERLTFKRGDANNDGAVDIADVVYILAVLFPDGQPPPVFSWDAMDANDDGFVNIADPTTLAIYVTGGQGLFVSDLGVCTLSDPTPDALPELEGTRCTP